MTSRPATSSSSPSDPRLERWLDSLLAAPGLTATRDPLHARRVHLEESLAAVPLIEQFSGSIVDVGSGGGAPGIPVAAALPARRVTLLEASLRKCAFLERAAAAFPNVIVVRGRAEEQPLEQFGVATAKALAPPPVAAEWCLPLVKEGGAVVLFVGPTVSLEAVACAAGQVGGGRPECYPGLVVIRKTASTPAGFPRRSGIARKRPLA